MDAVLGAGAVIIDAQGRVLLVLRRHDPQKARWSIPGGSAEPGETLQQTAAREVLEETGLHVRVGEELWTLHLPIGDGRVYEVHDFAATVIRGDLASGDDAADARWVDPAELDDLPLTADLASYLRRAGLIVPNS
jgi:8-oxo-dGTP diphosphatase